MILTTQENSSPTRRKGQPYRLFSFALIGLATLLILVALWPRLAFFVQQAGQRLPYPYFQSSSEGLILGEAALLHTGGSIYVPFRADLFISAPYPPFYYYLLDWLWSSDSSQLFGPGRWISLVAALATALLIAGIVALSAQKLPGKRPLTWLVAGAALLSGLAWLTLPAVAIWAVRVRADMLMTALQLAGLLLVTWGGRKNRDWPIFLAIIPFGLALYTKQTALAGPLASLLWLGLWYGRRWRVWLAWLISFGVAIGLPFLLLNLLSSNELYRRIFKYHNLPWQLSNFQSYFGLFLRENAGLLLAGAGLLLLALVQLWTVWRNNPGQKWLERGLAAGRSVPLVVWYWLAGLASLFSLGVAGGDHNHFLPVEAGNCLVAGLLLVKLLERLNWQRWLALAGLALFLVQFAYSSVPDPRYDIEFRPRDNAYQTEMGKIAAYIAGKPGPILSSEAGWYLLTGKNQTSQPYYNDLFTLTALDKKGLYSQAGLLEHVRHRDFSLIVAEGDLFSQAGRSDVWNPALIAAIQENYTLKFKDIWYTYEPKPNS